MHTTRILGLTRVERHNVLVGLAFCAPFLLGFLAFTLYPMVASFYYSFTHFDGLNPPTMDRLDQLSLPVYRGRRVQAGS